MELAILAAGYAEPTALGFGSEFWMSLAILVVFLGLIWKVPPVVIAMLDRKIAEIRATLAEAEGLRNEAEALKAEYEAKTRGAAGEAAELLANAQAEGDAIVKQAKVKADELIARRKKMASEKIAAAERAAIAQVRAKAADAATRAAATLIAANHGADADRKLVDSAIADLGNSLN